MLNTTDFANQIIAMHKADEQLRTKLLQSGELFEGYNKEMEALHIKNANQLNQLMIIYGYPTIEKVGEQANYSAWIIIQHAISLPLFMKQCAQTLHSYAGEHLAYAKQYAYLIDRILFFEDKPQLYGTQYDCNENGEMQMHAVDDEHKANERRKAIGLNSIEEQRLRIQAETKLEQAVAPKNLNQRNKEMLAWKQKVGWVG